MLTYDQALVLVIIYLAVLQLIALYQYVLFRRGHDRPFIRRIVYGETAVAPYLFWLGLGVLYALLFLVLWSVPHYGLFYFLALIFPTTALLMALVCERCADVPKLLQQYQYFLAAFLFYLVANIRLYSFEPGASDFLFFAKVYYIPTALLITGYLYFALRAAGRKPARQSERD
ncbi:hypothetical protein [Oceanithermus sp.]